MVVSIGVLVLLLLDVPLLGGKHADQQFRAMFTAQRGTAAHDRMTRAQSVEEAFEHAGELSVRRAPLSAKLTLEKKLKYGLWKMKPLTFKLITAGISAVCFLIGSFFFGPVLLVVCLLLGPIFMASLLQRSIDKRFNEFDKDYAPFLLSLVGLLKTGMNPMSAIEAASLGMDPTALIKLEIDVMLERLRYGVPEDASIGSFAEDVNHPEIELFVQALLLSRAVGGTLSDTLDRLARQTRKRQHFRNSANAAVGMQRGSIWVIIGIMVALELYLWIMYPEIVENAINDPSGWEIWQLGITSILSGIYWVRQVTKIKV